ncbi:MAG: hypothetical protein IKM97_05185 [Clostridia bacterium]|nr:hypothetical protein [Clostridia bacterium]
MKVLFAVSSENISEAIIKRYQKEYKEILSYKNVYYFNAILKEIQKDKTYNRIVISEDLEPFSNNNYDTIDKFIFEKLDSISDEAQDSNGKDTSIILICTDRRQKGNSLLVKLFGIGVYNALLGNDRSMEEVCKLINRPRTKKEAKTYYRIDTDDVNYKAENENEVSENEIQNILAHFKKLGKNTAKYCDSFNNIAVQYNDEQLKIIINCLPINVKAFLETNCETYQNLMKSVGGIHSVKNMVASAESFEGTIKKEISSKNVGQAGNITKPIVIPSAVRNATNKAQVLKSQVKEPNVPEQFKKINVQPNNNTSTMQQKAVARPVVFQEEPQEIQQQVQIEQEKPVQQTLGYQRPRRQVSNMARVNTTAVRQEQVKQPSINLNNDDQILEEKKSMINESALLQEENNEINEIQDIDESSLRRGRGRPKKTPVEGAIVKPKGKRGRPKKNQEDDEDDEMILPGLEVDDEDYGYEEVSEEENILPGIVDEEEDIDLQENQNYIEEANNDEATMLPGMGFEDEDVADEKNLEQEYTEEVSLPGIDDLEEDDELILEKDDTEGKDDLLPGQDNLEEDEDLFPGIDNTEGEGDLLPGIDNIEGEGDLLPGIDNLEEDGDLLPGIDNLEEDGDLLPGIDNTEEDEDLLPGFGNFDENIDQPAIQSQNVNIKSNVVESIKPRVDYSMSSLNSLITKDKKIVSFIGTSKNGVSFLVNNLAALFSSLGINTAILDMTQNKNSYYIYTKNEDELRNIAFKSIEKLQNGYAEGIRVDKNLSVYTALPNDGKDYSNAEPILSTLIQNHSLVLIDCDYDTDLTYFASCQEMYLVQSMDILTIQPLTAFLRELKTKGILEPEKIRVVINKELKVKSLSIKAIIGGLSYYNDPAMSFMTELFNKDMVKACTIPFEDNAYSKYLEGIVNCNISLNGFSKAFLSKLKILGDMVYSLTSKQAFGKGGQVPNFNSNAFSSSMNDTLSKMRKKY